MLCVLAEAQLEAGWPTSALCSIVSPWSPSNPLDFSYSVNSCVLGSTLYGLRTWVGFQTCQPVSQMYLFVWIRAVYSHRMPHSQELGRWLCPEGRGMTQWSLYSVDSHVEWHAKDPDRLDSPADSVTAAHTQPKPGATFLHCGWFSGGARCTY